MRAIRQIILCFLLLLIFVFSGCAGTTMKAFNQAYYGGKVQRAYDIAKKAALKAMPAPELESKQDTDPENAKKPSNDLLWQLQAGIVAFYTDPKEADAFLQNVDDLMQENIKNLAKTFFGNIGAILTSDEILPYPIYLYEACMVNYYLALDAMGRRDFSDARVYLNQALERQNDVKSYYAKEISKSQQYINNLRNTNDQSSKEAQYLALAVEFAKNHPPPALPVIQDRYINPMIIYIKVLFELTQNNFASIRAMGKDLDYILPEDKAIIKSRQSGSKKHYIWFVIEDGAIASKDTLKFSIPLTLDPAGFVGATAMMATSNPEAAALITAISGGVLLNYAEPKLIEGRSFAQDYRVDGKKAAHLFDLSSLMKTEFKKRLPEIRTRAILRAIPPSLLAFVANEASRYSFGVRGLGFLLSLFHHVIIGADIRSVTALPNSFYITRVLNDGRNKRLQIDGRRVLDFSGIDARKDAIIYIRNLGSKVYFRRLLAEESKDRLKTRRKDAAK